MILSGLAALVLATIGHHRSLQVLKAEYGRDVPYSLATLVAGLITALGILSLSAVLFRKWGCGRHADRERRAVPHQGNPYSESGRWDFIMSGEAAA